MAKALEYRYNVLNGSLPNKEKVFSLRIKLVDRKKNHIYLYANDLGTSIVQLEVDRINTSVAKNKRILIDTTKGIFRNMPAVKKPKLAPIPNGCATALTIRF